MPEPKAIQHIKNIRQKIHYIQNIIAQKGSIVAALEDEQNARAAILMHLTSIAEQFDKLLHSGELEMLTVFDKEDIKGSHALRNFIAHDYDGVDLNIVEAVIEERLPIMLEAIKALRI